MVHLGLCHQDDVHSFSSHGKNIGSPNSSSTSGHHGPSDDGDVNDDHEEGTFRPGHRHRGISNDDEKSVGW